MTTENQELSYLSCTLDKSTITKDAAADGFYIEGLANAATRDRSGDLISPTAYNLDNYLKNPVILLQHNRDQPIGRMVEHKIDDKGLWVKVFISSAAEDLYKTITLIKDGVLSAFSVGFRLLDGKYIPANDTFVITELEMLETSLVSIPCNQDSVFSESKDFQNLKSIKKEEAIATQANKALVITETSTEEESGSTSTSTEVTTIVDDKNPDAPIDPAIAAALLAKSNSGQSAETGEQPMATTKSVDVEAAVQKALEAERAKAKEIEDTKAQAAEAEAKRALEIKEAVAAAMKAASDEAETKAADETGIPMEKAGVQYTPSTMKEADKREYMKTLDDLYLLSVALEKPLSGLSAFKALPEEIQKAVTNTGGVSMAPVGFDKRLEQDIRKELKIEKLFSSFQMPLADYRLPFNAAGVTASFQAPGTAPADQNLTIDNILFTAKKIMAPVAFNYEDEDDAVIALLPTIRQEIAYAMANLIDTTLVTGTGVGGSFRGITHYATGAGAGFSTAIAGTAAADLTPANIAAARSAMGRYAIGSRDVALLINIQDYYKLADDPLVQTVTNYGSEATLKTGELSNIWGIPIIPTESIATPVNVGDVRACIVRPDRFKLGYRKNVNVENWRDPRNQTKSLTGSLRLDFNPLVPLTAGQLSATETFVHNITVGA